MFGFLLISFEPNKLLRHNWNSLVSQNRMTYGFSHTVFEPLHIVFLCYSEKHDRIDPGTHLPLTALVPPTITPLGGHYEDWKYVCSIPVRALNPRQQREIRMRFSNATASPQVRS